ncbi:kinase-like domain-containing protein, partial [Ochromonadaceae sp. CCMP2298]
MRAHRKQGQRTKVRNMVRDRVRRSGRRGTAPLRTRGAIGSFGSAPAPRKKGEKKGEVLPASGKADFIEIHTLGSGASGVVTEAIHVPSLTLVALKMLPVYNQEKRQHVSRELGVLYKNLAALKLVNASLHLEGEGVAGAGAGGGEGAEAKSNEGKEGEGEEDGKEGEGTVGVKGGGDGGGDRGAVGVGHGGSGSPHILSLYNAFVDPRSGMINLVIEYMDGGSLEDLVLQGGCRDEQVLADIAYQCIKGLCFLHAHRCVHRDIKPANILCSTSGLIKIADFGISKALDKTSGFANSFIGTVCYMSPERITGETYGFPCDVWSLGLTLLAVAQGRFPLSGERDEEGGSGKGSGRGEGGGE